MITQSTIAPRVKSNEKASRIFNQAKDAYEKGHRYNALQTARYALHIARRSGEYCKAYLYGFLAMLKWELGQNEMAAFYCRHAIRSLFSYHTDYKMDRQYYESMLKAIERS